MMNITREEVDKLNAKLKIKIEKEDYLERVENVLKDYKKRAQINGFRPGKVPFGMIKKMYYKPVLVDEINKIVSESITKYIVDEKLDILGEPIPSEEEHPHIDWENDTDFEFIFDLGLMPVFNLKISNSDKIPFYKIKADNSMIEEYKDNLSKKLGTYEKIETVTDNCLIKGDIKQLDEAGVPKEDGLKTEDASIFSGVIKDKKMKKSMEGKKEGDIVVLNIKEAFPNTNEVASILKIDKKEADRVEGEFQIQIKEISKFKNAEINQEFYNKLYGKDKIKTEEEFNEKLIEDIEMNLLHESEYRFFIEVKDSLLKKAKFDLPDEFLKRWILATNKDKFTKEDVEKEYDKFKQDLQWQIIKDKISREYEIKVTKEEEKEYAKRLAAMQLQQYGYMNVPEDQLTHFARGMLEKEEERRKIYERKLEEKIVDFIKQMIKIDNKSISKEKFNKLYEK